MRTLPLDWLDQLFYCADIGLARFLRVSPPLRLNPSPATGLLTMSLVVGGFEIIALGRKMFGAAVTSSIDGSAIAPSAKMIILACACVWFVISYRCVYQGAREAIHRRFAADASESESKRKRDCVLFMLIVYAVLPLLLVD